MAELPNAVFTRQGDRIGESAVKNWAVVQQKEVLVK
jgi:hypothetical protein